jgi:hypothetical protein
MAAVVVAVGAAAMAAVDLGAAVAAEVAAVHLVAAVAVAAAAVHGAAAVADRRSVEATAVQPVPLAGETADHRDHSVVAARRCGRSVVVSPHVLTAVVRRDRSAAATVADRSDRSVAILPDPLAAVTAAHPVRSVNRRVHLAKVRQPVRRSADRYRAAHSRIPIPAARQMADHRCADRLAMSHRADRSSKSRRVAVSLEAIQR